MVKGDARFHAFPCEGTNFFCSLTSIPYYFPTVDPVLLVGGDDTTAAEWDYPPGVPTPDPALLTDAVEDIAVTWG